MSGPLAGQKVALSISTAHDVAKLGFPAREFDRALLVVCGALVRAGAQIAYGGNVDPFGYTFKIFTFLAKEYAGREMLVPFVQYLPEGVLREAEFDLLRRYVQDGSGVVDVQVVLGGQVAATLVVLDDGLGLRSTGGGPLTLLTMREAFDAWVREHAKQPGGEALTAMRQLVSARCAARIAMGGKMGVLSDPLDRYNGAMPGVVEEVLETLRQRKLPIVLGAFGGAARDVAIALGLLDARHRVPRGPQAESYWPALAQVETLREQVPPGLRPALEELAALENVEAVAHRVVALLARL